MADIFSKRKRSQIMSRIGDRGSASERRIYDLLLLKRLRFTYQQTDLPGRPDFVFRQRKKIIFVHGCFWHQHVGCNRCTSPSSNRRDWRIKLASNVSRDRLTAGRLRRAGWRIMTIWECEIRPSKIERLEARLTRFLRTSASNS